MSPFLSHKIIFIFFKYIIMHICQKKTNSLMLSASNKIVNDNLKH